MTISFASLAGGSKYQRTVIITSTQSWVCPTGVTSIELFLVGGGGGGEYSASYYNSYNSSYNYGDGGGGGGGGVIQQTLPVTPGETYGITIGAGGAVSSDGGDSVFYDSLGTISTSYGGGKGTGMPTSFPMLPKASGGGMNTFNGSFYGASGGAGSAPFPLYAAASDGTHVNTYWRGVQGQPAPSRNLWGGSGGPGLNGYGSGGGAYNANTYRGMGFGGLNAGNSANQASDATPGKANFGGGGGGGSYNYGKAASAGGSGICIIKYWA